MKKLSNEHKRKISESLVLRWKRGDFNSNRIRNIWRKTALLGIAKKGKPNPNKYIPSQEMLDDYSKMGDKDLSNKYEVSRRLVIKIRKEYNLPTFNLQHGTKLHEFRDGKEYKWCQKGHWELVENFGIHSSRYDGLRGHCKLHANESSKKSQTKRHATPEGKAAVRFQNNRRKTAVILWEYQDEKRAMELYQNRCGYCGTRVTYRTVEFDHIIPVAKGGKTIPENMLPSCMECNRGVNGKKAKEVMVWLKSKFGIDRAELILEDIQRKQSIISMETSERLSNL